MIKSTNNSAEALKNHIENHCNGAILDNLDASVAIALEVSGDEVRIRIQDGDMQLTDVAPDWTIYLPDEATALALLEGRAHPIELFMQNKLKSSGYIVTTFRVLQSLMSPLPAGQ